LRFPQEREIIITDTVGFIRELPEDLMAAFRTTFEELDEADLLLHVVDAHSPDLSDKMKTVLDTVRSLELDHKPIVTVFNKIDLCSPEEIEGLLHQYEGVPVCALDRGSFAPLLTLLEERLWPAD
jgi:GTP-binding protein HflX